MNFHLDIDVRALQQRFDLTTKQAAYIGVNAINKTAKRIQAAEREHVSSTFTLRKREFVLRQAAVIKPFASVRQGRTFAEISVGQKPRLFLSTFEKGGPRPPAKGKGAAAPVIGSPARPSFPQPVPPAMRFAALRLSKTRTKAGVTRSGRRRRSRPALGVRFGLLGTYQVPGVGVFQRAHPAEPSRLVYAFTQGQRLDDELEFVATARRVADAWFREELERETVDAIAHARSRVP